MAKETKSVKVQFKFERGTKGALRFMEVDDSGEGKQGDAAGAVLGTVYFRKAGLEKAGIKGEPATLTMTLEF